MADNYLERKMEEHRNGGAFPKRRLTPKGTPMGKALIDFPPLRVFVVGGAAGHGATAVKAFCDAGCRVAFCDLDHKAGSATAQRCGAQFHPISSEDAIISSMERVENAWGPIELVISTCAMPIPHAHGLRRAIFLQQGKSTLPPSEMPNANVIAIPDNGLDEKALTAILLLLSCPAASAIHGQTFRL